MTSNDVQPVTAGDWVRVVTETYEPRKALVTAVHGTFGESDYVPCINALYITSDEAKRDPYGLQPERLSSLQHVSQASGMPRPGRYWVNA